MYLTPRSTNTCFKDMLSRLWFLEGYRGLDFYIPFRFVYSHSEIKTSIKMESVVIIFCD